MSNTISSSPARRIPVCRITESCDLLSAEYLSASGSDLKNVRVSNIKAVFDAISRNPGVSRSEISDITGLSLMTIGKILDVFSRKDVIVQEKDGTGSGLGRKVGLVRINYSACYVIIDLSSYDFTMCIHNVLTERIEKYVYEYNHAADFTDNLRSFMSSSRSRIQNAVSDRRIIAVGVSLPGPYDPATDRTRNNRMPELNGISIVKMIEFGLGLPVTCIDENVKLSIFAHMLTIPDYDKKELVYLHIGDGVGGGIALNGRIVRGAGQFAGDMGQLILTGSGRTLEQIIRAPESEKELYDALTGFFYNAMWFLDPDAFIIEYDGKKNPHISEETFRRFESMTLPLSRKFPELIITGEIKKSHAGLGRFICENWLERALLLPDRI